MVHFLSADDKLKNFQDSYLIEWTTDSSLNSYLQKRTKIIYSLRTKSVFGRDDFFGGKKINSDLEL